MDKQYYFKRHGLLHDKLSPEHRLLTPGALEAPNRDRLLPLFFELTRKLSSFWLAFIVLENTRGDVGEEKT